MKPIFVYKKLLWATALLVPIALGAISISSAKADKAYGALPPNQCDCYSSTPLYKVPITFNDSVPGDLPSFTVQSQADCFAWKEFITLNWPTAGNSFGNPGDTSPVQWETYMPREAVFPPNGAKPAPWGTLLAPKYAAKFKANKMLMQNSNIKILSFVSKFDDDDPLVSFSPSQAAPQNEPNWLGAQNGTNVWYEIKLNKDYYDFVVKKGYYNAKTQHDSVKAGHPINFPQGQYKGITGAIELKAAWMEVPDPQSAKWKRYKLSKAVVVDPITEKLRNTTVALVGMHILHKTSNQPTWVWATFEHIDNVPGSDPSPPYGYNFYNSSCKPQNVTIKTPKGSSTVSVTCTPNTSPPYYLNQAGPVPLQTTRINAIDQVDAAPANAMMQQNIRQYYPNSVWQYYQLVDVIWSQSKQPDPTKPIYIPRKLNASSMASGDPHVANTTMETYAQTITCTNCHTFSSIAAYPPDATNDSVFGDFSFAIKFAKYPLAGNTKTKHHALSKMKNKQ